VDWEAYQRLFDGAGSRVAGEASAMYLTLPGVAGEIARRCPEAKIVFILRDPVARAHSAWLYLRGQGREHLQEFADALDAEPSRRQAGFGPMWWYVAASRYQVGLREFYEHFPSSSVLVLTTEELRADPRGVLGRVCGHLGVGGDVDLQVLAGEVNASGVPRAEWLARSLYPSDRLRAAAVRVAPAILRQWVRQARVSALRPPDPIPEECRGRLAEQLSDVAKEVAELTGVDTTGWISGAVPPGAGTRG
jgi:hypothetical protein